jgi:hypothetical protein
MAKEIKPIERQVLTPNVAINPGTPHTTMAEATSQLGQLAADVLTDTAAYYSGLAGEEDALKGKAPKTLGPPIGKATRAYNEAVIKTEARQLAGQGRDMIMQTYAEMSNPATFNTQTPAEFNAKVTGIMQGVLDNTRPENRGIVQAQLQEYAANAKIRMLDTAIKYDNAQTEMSFNTDLEKAQNELQEARYSQNPDLIKIAEFNRAEILKDYATINQAIADQLPAITKKLNEQDKVDRVVADFLQAYNQGQEVQYLDKLTKEKPEGYTTAEYFTAMQKVLQVENSLQATENRYNQEQFAKAHYEITSGQITNLDQLQLEYGNKVPAANFYALSEALFRQKETIDSVFVVETARSYGPNEVAKLPNKVLNDYYVEKERQILETINANIPEGELPLQRLTLAQRAEFIVLPAGAPIPDFLTDLSYALKNPDPMISTDALNAYRVLFRNQGTFGTTLKGLDTQADDIAQYVLAVGDVSEGGAANLIQTAQNNANDRSDSTMVARRERLQKLYTMKDGINVIQSTYKKTYGVLPNNANSDAHYGAFQKLFDNYFMGVANGSETVALSMTQNALRDWGKSRFGQKDALMYAPPDLAIPFANVGYWMDNQYGEALNAVLSRHEDLQTGIARPKWMADIPINADTTDQQIMETKYYPKYAALINGVEREVYIQSTRNTRTSSFPGEVYQFYYLDDYGVKQYLSDPNNPLGSANWVAQTMDEYVPNAYAAIKEETFDQVAREVYDRENKNKIDAFGNTNLPAGLDVATFGLASQLGRKEPSEQDIADIKDRLRKVGKEQIVFKGGKPVAGNVNQPMQGLTLPPLQPKVEEQKKTGKPINPDEIGRRKKK